MINIDSDPHVDEVLEHTLNLANVSLVFCIIRVYCNACTVVASSIHTSSLCYVIQVVSS